jgi:hypothetical protein
MVTQKKRSCCNCHTNRDLPSGSVEGTSERRGGTLYKYPKEKEVKKRKCCSWLFLHGNQRKWTKFLKDERLKRFLKDIR